jgi:hypothetical protein
MARLNPALMPSFQRGVPQAVRNRTLHLRPGFAFSVPYAPALI